MSTEILTNKNFFGRTEHIKLLRERAKSFRAGFRQNVAIIGRPFMGKTLLIQNFLNDLDRENIVPIYITTQAEHFNFFAQRFISSLFFNYLKSKSIESKNDGPDELLKQSKKLLPKTTEAVESAKNFIKKKEFDYAYDILFELPQILHAESGAISAVIIEEFDRLSEYRLNQPFSVLGKKIMAQRNTFYVVTSSSVNLARQILHERLQLLFGNFEVLQLDGFDFTSSEAFLISRLDSFNISDKQIKFLAAFTDGHPFYLDVIAARLKEMLIFYDKKTVTDSLLQDTMEAVLFHPLGPLHQHFVNIIEKYHSKNNGVDVSSALISLSEGNHKLKRLNSLLGFQPKNISGTLSNLERSGFVDRCGSFARIEDLLMRFWLRSVYRRKRMDFDADPLRRQQEFKAQIRNGMSDFLKILEKDLYEKVVDLFKTFDNEVVQIDNKKHILPRFCDVAIRVIGEAGPYIVGHSKGKNWICQIREREVGEKAILDFMKDVNSGKYKFHRKVLIILNSIDENAKLMAKNSAVWMWDAKTLDLLLDLYGKHKLIR